MPPLVGGRQPYALKVDSVANVWRPVGFLRASRTRTFPFTPAARIRPIRLKIHSAFHRAVTRQVEAVMSHGEPNGEFARLCDEKPQSTLPPPASRVAIQLVDESKEASAIVAVTGL